MSTLNTLIEFANLLSEVPQELEAQIDSVLREGSLDGLVSDVEKPAPQAVEPSSST